MIQEQKDKMIEKVNKVNIALKKAIPALKNNIELFELLEQMSIVKYKTAPLLWMPILYFFDVIPSRKMVRKSHEQLEQLIISRMSFRYTIKKFKTFL